MVFPMQNEMLENRNLNVFSSQPNGSFFALWDWGSPPWN